MEAGPLIDRAQVAARGIERPRTQGVGAAASEGQVGHLLERFERNGVAGLELGSAETIGHHG